MLKFEKKIRRQKVKLQKKNKQLIRSPETVSVHCEDLTKRMKATVLERRVVFGAKTGGIYINHLDLRSKKRRTKSDAYLSS